MSALVRKERTTSLFLDLNDVDDANVQENGKQSRRNGNLWASHEKAKHRESPGTGNLRNIDDANVEGIACN